MEEEIWEWLVTGNLLEGLLCQPQLCIILKHKLLKSTPYKNKGVYNTMGILLWKEEKWGEAVEGGKSGEVLNEQREEWCKSCKDPDVGKDWRQEKGMTEDKMVGWHHWLDGHEFKHALGVGDAQGSLALKPGMLQSMGSQQIGHDWVTELKWRESGRDPILEHPEPGCFLAPSF